MVRFTGAEAVVFASAIGFDVPRIFAHRAFCASAIFRRDAAEIIRVGAGGEVDADVIPVDRDAAEPFNDSITEIA